MPMCIWSLLQQLATAFRWSVDGNIQWSSNGLWFLLTQSQYMLTSNTSEKVLIGRFYIHFSFQKRCSYGKPFHHCYQSSPSPITFSVIPLALLHGLLFFSGSFPPLQPHYSWQLFGYLWSYLLQLFLWKAIWWKSLFL